MGISLRSIRSPIFNKNKRYPRLTVPILRTNTFQTRPFTSTTTKMSFSNADTGSKNADPYKATNKDETSIQEKVEDLSEFVKACKFGMMTTRDGSSGALVSRCMALAAQETGGIDLIFHTNTESGKTNDIDSDSHINISFLNSSGEWASVSGKASIVTDRDGKHDGSENDPRIGVIRVEAVTATYAVVRKNAVSRAAEMAQGVITGKAPAVNKLREISEQELSTWRSSNKMVN